MFLHFLLHKNFIFKKNVTIHIELFFNIVPSSLKLLTLREISLKKLLYQKLGTRNFHITCFRSALFLMYQVIEAACHSCAVWSWVIRIFLMSHPKQCWNWFGCAKIPCIAEHQVLPYWCIQTDCMLPQMLLSMMTM